MHSNPTRLPVCDSMGPQGDAYEEEVGEAQDEREHRQVRCSRDAWRPVLCHAGLLRMQLRPRPAHCSECTCLLNSLGSREARQAPYATLPLQAGPPARSAWPSLASGPPLQPQPSHGSPAAAVAEEPEVQTGPAWGGGGAGGAASGVWSAGAANVVHDLKRAACIQELRGGCGLRVVVR